MRHLLSAADLGREEALRILDTAEAMAVSGHLFCEPFPFETPTLDLSMVWLSHVDTDPAERWVRSRLEAFMSDRGLATKA